MRWSYACARVLSNARNGGLENVPIKPFLVCRVRAELSLYVSEGKPGFNRVKKCNNNDIFYGARIPFFRKIGSNLRISKKFTLIHGRYGIMREM